MNEQKRFGMSNEEVRRIAEKKEFNKKIAIKACKALVGLVFFGRALYFKKDGGFPSYGPETFGGLTGGLIFSAYQIGSIFKTMIDRGKQIEREQEMDRMQADREMMESREYYDDEDDYEDEEDDDYEDGEGSFKK